MLRTLLAMALIMLTVELAASEDEVQFGAAPGATEQEIKNTISFALAGKLIAPNVLAFGPDELRSLADKAKEIHASLKTTNGDLQTYYDIILQPGHYPRTKDRTGGQGKYVSEQQYAAWIASLVAGDLSKRNIKVALIPADGYTKNLRGQIFLSLHTDASAFPCKVGPSVGYEKVGDAKGMHHIALALATSLNIDPTKFMRDSYTSALKHYYAFREINATLFKGVLEMSELTCPPQEERLLSNAEVLARNLVWAIVLALRKPVE